MSLETIHQATCDRCKKVATVAGPQVVPDGWVNEPVANNGPTLLCLDCIIQLDKWLAGANIRKPRTPKAVPDAE